MKIFLNENVCQVHYYDQLMIVILDDLRQIFIKDYYIQDLLKQICKQGFYDTIELLEKKEGVAKLIEVDRVLMNKIESSYLQDFLSLNNTKRLVPLTGIKGKKIPLKLQIEITRKCNMECPHCYKMANLDRDSLTTLQVKDVLNKIGMHLFEIGITGGEPLVHREFINITNLISQYAPTLSLNTNGLLLYKMPVEVLKKYKFISISLYGTTNEEYSHVCKYEKAFECLRNGTNLLLKNNIKFNFSVLLDSRNCSRIEEYINVAINLGAAGIQFGTISNIGREKEQEKQGRVIEPEKARQIYRKIRQMKNLYEDKINIVEWSRDWISVNKRDIFQATCFTCEAGSLQWIMTEKERFKPCVILPEEKELEFSKKEFFDNINKNVDINWKKFYDKLIVYCCSNCQNVTDFCDRIKNPGGENEKAN